MGVKQKVKGKLCGHLISDSILRLFYFTPNCLVSITPWTRRAQKELYEKRQQQIGDEAILFYFPLFQQPFNGWGNFPWIQLKWLNPPVKVSKIMLIVSWYMRVLIWYFKTFNMVLVAFGSLSKSSVLVCSSIS